MVLGGTDFNENANARKIAINGLFGDRSDVRAIYERGEVSGS